MANHTERTEYTVSTVLDTGDSWSGITTTAADVNGGAVYVSGADTLVSGESIGFANDTGAKNGGAVFVAGGTLALVDPTFTDNTATNRAAALYGDVGSFITVDGGEFSGNSAASYGGAIFTNASDTYTGVTFSSNTAAAGGAVFVDSYGVHYFVDCDFLGNSATTDTASDGGGAIRVDGWVVISGGTFGGNRAVSYGGALVNFNNTTINNTLFADNRTTGSGKRGGAISSEGTLTVTGATFVDNYASAHGGAIHARRATTITGAIFRANVAGSVGGALYISGGTVEVTDSLFVDGNTANQGGAIFHEGAMLTLAGSTFIGNYANVGGAILNGTTLEIVSGRFEGNVAISTDGSNGGGALYNVAAATISGGEIVGNSGKEGGAVRNEGTLNITGGTFFGNLASNGGAIGTSSNSTAISGDAVFIGNSAGNVGGAVYVRSGALSVSGGYFSGNTTKYGGVIYHEGSTAIIEGGTFPSRTAEESSGEPRSSSPSTLPLLRDSR